MRAYNVYDVRTEHYLYMNMMCRTFRYPIYIRHDSASACNVRAHKHHYLIIMFVCEQICITIFAIRVERTVLVLFLKGSLNP